jgi:cell shape-determining protein MreC
VKESLPADLAQIESLRSQIEDLKRENAQMTEQLQRVQALMTQNAGESAVIKNLQQEIERQKGLIQARDKKME